MAVVHIKTPWWSAGHKFHWAGKPAGIGIAVEHFIKTDDKIFVRVGDGKQTYVLDRIEAVAFIQKHNSLHFTKGKKLGVVPLHMLKSVTLN